MNNPCYIGIDPGKNGSIAFLSPYWYGVTVGLDSTPRDISESLEEMAKNYNCIAIIEQVSSSPQMGVKSAFTFGQGFGMLEGLLTAHCIPFERVRPQVWQKAMGCMTGGNKNITKRRAQELFPKVKVTHKIADALLIAEYCRRLKS